MQSIKDKLHDMTAIREAKAEAKQQEKAEKEFAKARVEVAHEVRLAREAEAAMDVHVNRAAEKAMQHEEKHPEAKSNNQGNFGEDATGRPYTNDDFYSPDDSAASTGDLSRNRR